MMKELVMYSLLTVNGSGEVYYTRGFETPEMCEIAKSVALYGMTPAEIKEGQRKQKEAREEWLRNNPPREAKTDNERKWVIEVLKQREQDKANGSQILSSGSGAAVTDAGLIQDVWPGDRSSMSPQYRFSDGEWMDVSPLGGWIPKNRFSIKTAKCIFEPEAK